MDYLHVLVQNGWRSIEMNPLIDDDNNPSTPRVRALAADLQRVYGDPNLLSSVAILCACNKGLYDAVDVHFERRLAQTAFQVNYSLAWARGMGGSSDFTTQGGYVGPENVDRLAGLQKPDGAVYADTEWGPTQNDERHRVTVAGVIPLPGGIDVAPSFTAATARPYTQFSAPNPNGSGLLYLRVDGVPQGAEQRQGQGAHQRQRAGQQTHQPVARTAGFRCSPSSTTC